MFSERACWRFEIQDLAADTEGARNLYIVALAGSESCEEETIKAHIKLFACNQLTLGKESIQISIMKKMKLKFSPNHIWICD